MKVARLYSSLDIRLEEEEIPRTGSGDVLVRTKACGICSGDVLPWYIERKAPLVLGHEPTGEVVEVGREVESLRSGDRVFAHHHAPCLRCRMCRRGNFVQCSQWRATRIFPGGMSEYFLVPGENLADTLILPDALSFEEGTLIEPVACTVKSLRRANIAGGERVVMVGLGVMGQLHVVLARHYGAEKVVGVDLMPYRCQKALELGADTVIDASRENVTEIVREITEGEMAEVVIVGPGTVEAVQLGIACAAKGSTVILFTPTPPEKSLSLSLHDLYFREIRLVPSYSCGPGETREALHLLSAGVVNGQAVITHRFPLDEIARAYRVAAEMKESLKTVVVFPEPEVRRTG